MRKCNQDASLPKSRKTLVYDTKRSRRGLFTPFLGSFGNSIANLSFSFVVIAGVLVVVVVVVIATCACRTFSLDFQHIFHQKL
jgi:hypothetical protein